MNNIKRMASKFALRGGKDSISVTSNTAPYISPPALYDHRGSISTDTSDWSNRTGDSMDSYNDLFNSAMPISALAPPSTSREYRLSDFLLERTLGTGSFGRVHLVRSRHNDQFYAIKVLSKDKVVRMKQIEHTNNEVRLLQTVECPFIVSLYGSFQDTANLYMIMDFVPGGELFTLLRRSTRFPEPVAKFYAGEVALALDYLHKKGIIYRDLKPENILLARDGHIKLTDFGFAKACTTTTWTLCGTPDYLAPELVNQQRYNKSVDWYALGVLLYEMISGWPPFHLEDPMKNPVELYERITRGVGSIVWSPDFSPLARDVITHLMDPDPSKRYGNMIHGPRDFFNHKFFAEVDWTLLVERKLGSPFVPDISWEGDASAFDMYPEDIAQMDYGMHTPDPHGILFPEFEYTADAQKQHTEPLDPQQMFEIYDQLSGLAMDTPSPHQHQPQNQYYSYPAQF